MNKIGNVKLGALGVFLGFFLTAGLVWADAAPRCKCEAAGAIPPGGLAAGMAMAGAGLLLVLRGRRPSGL